MSMIRTRWAAIGAAVAVALGGGGLFVANAADSTSDSLYHAVTPVRVMDTRVGGGAAVTGTVKLDLEGTIATYNADGSTTNTEVVPDSASAVAINLTVTSGQKNGDYGFVTAFPCTATTDAVPTASSLNFENRIDVANALNVTTSSSGEICLNVYGTAHLIIDVAGYYDDNRIDAIAADYLDNDASITMTYQANGNLYNLLYGGTIASDDFLMQATLTNGVGGVGFDIPSSISSMGTVFSAYRLSSIQICIPANGNSDGGYISDVAIYKGGANTEMYDFTSLNAADWASSANCETWTIPENFRVTSNVHRLAIVINDDIGTNGDVKIQLIRATFEPYSTISLVTPGFGL